MINFTFFGTPDIASQTLELLQKSGYVPTCIVTSPDKAQGRGLHVQASPVGLFAEQNNIPCLKPEKIDDDFLKTLAEYKSDIFIVVAYGKILPENLITIPAQGTYNIHYSLLPKYRGASPVQSAILNSDTQTGVTIQKMIFKLDAGDIVAQEITSISETETTPELLRRLVQIGAQQLIQIFPDIATEKINPQKQDDSAATLCKKITKESALIDLGQNARDNYNKYRAYKPWPRTYFIHHTKDKDIRIIISEAEYKDGVFTPIRVIPEGKKEISYQDFCRNNNQ